MRTALLIALITIFVAGWFALAVLWFMGLRAYRKWLGALIARREVPSWLLGLAPPYRGFWRVPPGAIISFQPMFIILRRLARSDPDAETELHRRRVVRIFALWLAIFMGMGIDFAAIWAVSP